MTTEVLRIGTRDSILATWQARHVEDALVKAGHSTELRFIKTEGDRTLDTPLPLMGGKGVFTKALDDALIAGEIDLAVHSLKDIPTRLPGGLLIGAVCEREDPGDVLVIRSSAARDKTAFSDPEYKALIASSSNRRIGQWLSRYPHHRITDIRGNIQTRLRKLSESNWDGAIFAAAGLKRLGLDQHIHRVLDWMVPAPAQGAIGVMVRKEDPATRDAVMNVHDPDTAMCTVIEREVLQTLEGGCSAPVGALAVLDGNVVHLNVSVVYPDGTGLIRFDMKEPREKARDLGKRAAEEALNRGADTLIRYLHEGKEKR